jgi:hypothetical protein
MEAVYVNRKPFGAESNVMYRNELNRPATGVHTGGRAGGAARKEITHQTHGLGKYGRTQADVLLPDGTNANRTLVKDGWCWGYRTYAPGYTVPSLGPVPDRIRWAGQEGVEVLSAGEQDHGDDPISRRNRLSVSTNFVMHGGQ